MSANRIIRWIIGIGVPVLAPVLIAATIVASRFNGSSLEEYWLVGLGAAVVVGFISLVALPVPGTGRLAAAFMYVPIGAAIYFVTGLFTSCAHGDCL